MGSEPSKKHGYHSLVRISGKGASKEKRDITAFSFEALNAYLRGVLAAVKFVLKYSMKRSDRPHRRPLNMIILSTSGRCGFAQALLKHDPG